MANESENDVTGSGFVMGLLTGAVLGAGLGMLFAPKAGSEIRGQISEGANAVGRTASHGYRRATDAAGSIAEKGKEYYGRAREVVSRGADKAKSYGNNGKERPGESMPSGIPMTNPTAGSIQGPGGI
jgi:gas vesicle protein